MSGNARFLSLSYSGSRVYLFDVCLVLFVYFWMHSHCIQKIFYYRPNHNKVQVISVAGYTYTKTYIHMTRVDLFIHRFCVLCDIFAVFATAHYLSFIFFYCLACDDGTRVTYIWMCFCVKNKCDAREIKLMAKFSEATLFSHCTQLFFSCIYLYVLFFRFNCRNKVYF